jgi:hypothetical protein
MAAKHSIRTERKGFPDARTAIAAAVVALLVLAVFVMVSSRGGEAAEDSAPAAVQPAPEPPLAEEPEVPEATEEGGVVETFEVFAPRDPFAPVVETGGRSGGDVTAGRAGGSRARAATSSTGTEAVGGSRVSVVNASSDGSGRAQVQVDSTVYDVAEDETFAQNYQLVTVSGECSTMLFGDDQFTLCEGDQILK